ncbi:hypothetical protein HOG48_04440 [Candidatus Peregrinibacteria bacterium]|jgi:hypothetical protein|nr:hypothetical protein [Candidatus Peregrinibacteria bacterium]
MPKNGKPTSRPGGHPSTLGSPVPTGPRQQKPTNPEPPTIRVLVQATRTPAIQFARPDDLDHIDDPAAVTLPDGTSIMSIGGIPAVHDLDDELAEIQGAFDSAIEAAEATDDEGFPDDVDPSTISAELKGVTTDDLNLNDLGLPTSTMFGTHLNPPTREDDPDPAEVTLESMPAADLPRDEELERTDPDLPPVRIEEDDDDTTFTLPSEGMPAAKFGTATPFETPARVLEADVRTPVSPFPAVAAASTRGGLSEVITGTHRLGRRPFQKQPKKYHIRFLNTSRRLRASGSESLGNPGRIPLTEYQRTFSNRAIDENLRVLESQATPEELRLAYFDALASCSYGEVEHIQYGMGILRKIYLTYVPDAKDIKKLNITGIIEGLFKYFRQNDDFKHVLTLVNFVLSYERMLMQLNAILIGEVQQIPDRDIRTTLLNYIEDYKYFGRITRETRDSRKTPTETAAIIPTLAAKLAKWECPETDTADQKLIADSVEISAHRTMKYLDPETVRELGAHVAIIDEYLDIQEEIDRLNADTTEEANEGAQAAADATKTERVKALEARLGQIEGSKEFDKGIELIIATATPIFEEMSRRSKISWNNGEAILEETAKEPITNHFSPKGANAWLKKNIDKLRSRWIKNQIRYLKKQAKRRLKGHETLEPVLEDLDAMPREYERDTMANIMRTSLRRRPFNPTVMPIRATSDELANKVLERAADGSVEALWDILSPEAIIGTLERNIDRTHLEIDPSETRLDEWVSSLDLEERRREIALTIQQILRENKTKNETWKHITEILDGLLILNYRDFIATDCQEQLTGMDEVGYKTNNDAAAPYEETMISVVFTVFQKLRELTTTGEQRTTMLREKSERAVGHAIEADEAIGDPEVRTFVIPMAYQVPQRLLELQTDPTGATEPPTTQHEMPQHSYSEIDPPLLLLA